MKLKPIEVKYELSDALAILRNAGNKRVTDTKKIKPTFLDTFLYSGRFNSVLGIDGFQVFKNKLREVVKKVNSDDFSTNYMNLDDMFEILLSSGVYYLEQYLPQELQELKKDQRWLTAYRYIAKNFPDITYKEFREIVKRFQDSDGHSFFIAPDDSKGLQSITKHMELFREAVDAKAALLQLSQKELKAICESIGAKAARSTEDTADRIIEMIGEKALDHLPAEAKTRKTLFIKDEELATGEDIIHLDGYLRSIAKVVRDDLIEFINKQRHGVLAA